MDLSSANVLLVLQEASSVVRDNRQQNAEAQLKAWDGHKGYHFLLQNVYNDQSQALQVRWLAIICLKNGIEKYWKKTRINSITDEEKTEIRRGLFNNLNESNNQLAIQNAHSVARIARFDFPLDWPTLFEDFIQILEANASLDNEAIVKVNNLLIILNQVLKNLAAVRIGKARISLQAKVPLMVPHLIKFYHIFFDKWTKDYDTTTMQVGYICLKTIRRCIVDGYVNPHRETEIQDFFASTLQHLQKLLVTHENLQLTLLERYIKCYVKLYYNLANNSPTSFILMSSSRNILLTLLSLLQQKASIIYQVDDNSDNSEFWEQIAIKSFLVLKKLTTFTFKKGATIIRQKNDKNDVEKATNIMTSEFFTQSLLENLLELIITWYLKLRPSDLESWFNEPEEWVTEELQVSWEYQIRPCAENYFQELVIYFKDFLSQLILNKIEATLANPDIDILTKDSILAVFQLSATAIHEQCNFHNLLTGFFIPEALKVNDPNYKVIKRRVCLIINEWISIKCSPETRDIIYNFIAKLLDPNESTNDQVVRLTALQTLRFMVDDWEFRKQKFDPYLDTTIYRVLELLKNLNFTECKISVLNVLALIIERTNPLLNEKVLIEIVSMAPVLWQSSDSPDKMIIKVSILRLLRDLTTSLNDKSELIYELVIPLLPVCCDPGSEHYSLLSEEGLELWSAVIRQLPIGKPIPKELLSPEFLNNIMHALVSMTEVLPMVLSVLRSYAILAPEIFETEFGLEIFKIIGGYLATMRDDILFVTCQFLEILLINQNKETIRNSNTFKSLVESGLFSELIKYMVRDSDNFSCEIKVALPILRLMYIDSQFFIYCLQSVTDNETTIPLLLYKLLCKLTSYNKMVHDLKVKKLYLLGLMSFYHREFFTHKLHFETDNVEYELLQLNESDAVSLVLASYFPSILEMAVFFLEETKETPQGDCQNYHKQTAFDDDSLKLVQTEEEFLEENAEDPNNEYVLEFKLPDYGEQIRYTQLLLNRDIVHTVVSKNVVATCLSDVYSILSSNIPSNLVEELKIFLRT